MGLAGLHTSDNIATIHPRPAGGRQHNRLNQNQATDLCPELHVSFFWALPEEYMLMMQDLVSPVGTVLSDDMLKCQSASSTVGPIVRRLKQTGHDLW